MCVKIELPTTNVVSHRATGNRKKIVHNMVSAKSKMAVLVEECAKQSTSMKTHYYENHLKR